jgi:glycosyltransferase involved in cell wall biosynthesis
LHHTHALLQTIDLARETRLQILVFDGDTPLGYVHINLDPRTPLTAERLNDEIQRQLGPDIRRAEAVRRFLPPSPLEPAALPALTVAVCTRNRASSLRRTLRSLNDLQYPADKLDLLVVDNAPDDDSTREVVAEFAGIRYEFEPRPGLDWARNRAIQAARGDIIAYTDDDVVVDANWARALAQHMQHPAVMCVTGLVAPAELDHASQQLFEDYGGFGRGFVGRYFSMADRRHWRFFPLGAGSFGTGCNMAYRRSLFAEIGGFDPALDVGTVSRGAGDHDMFYRTLRAGYILVYEPCALVWHYHRADYAALHRQMNDFGRGVYAFWTKTFLRDRPMRWKTATFALIWFYRWFVRRLLKPGILPRDLVRAEAIGALQGPWAYALACRHDAWLTQVTTNLCQPESSTTNSANAYRTLSP